ncbi:MAG: VWA domain-containing protein [Akkermansia sp.]|nr:VWA domain-containing protein [Akkermansia sp.]
MAIHVRTRSRQRRLLRNAMRRIALQSLLISLALVLSVALVLLLRSIVLMPPSSAAFTFAPPTEPPPTQPTEEDPRPQQDPGGGGGSVSLDMPTITVDVPTAVSMPSVEGLGLEQTADDSSSMGIGMGIGDGIGLGEGPGKGMGSGGGSGGGRGKGKGAGKNDDLQLVLLLDASGSMDQLLAAAADSMAMMVAVFNQSKLNGQKLRVNIGLVCYGQSENGGQAYKLSDFSMDEKAMKKALEGRRADGAFESCGEAIDFAVENFEWNRRDREDVLKVIFIAGNESFDQGSVDYRAAIRKARESNIIVNTVYCGSVSMSGTEEQQWSEAAGLGSGRALTFEFGEAGEKKEIAQVRRELFEAAKRLYECPVVPIGSPAEQAAHEKTFAERPRFAAGADRIFDWISDHSDLISGYCWDATEICRRAGKDFKLYMVGGRANLPAAFRHMSDEEAEATLMQAAEVRQRIIESFEGSTTGGNVFARRALETVRDQARAKGIDIKI